MRIIKDITDFIFIDDEMKQSDIIFIPGGSHPELGEHAAELWAKGLAPMIMPSGGVSIKTGKFNGVKSKKEIYNKEYKTDCEFLVDVLRINGVPQEAILEENTSSFTKENALFSRKVADEQGLIIRSAIICCKAFHARRALMCYQLAFPHTEFLVHAVPYHENNVSVSKDDWHQTEIGIKRVMGELQRCGAQFGDEMVALSSTGR